MVLKSNFSVAERGFLNFRRSMVVVSLKLGGLLVGWIYPLRRNKVGEIGEKSIGDIGSLKFCKSKNIFNNF